MNEMIQEVCLWTCEAGCELLVLQEKDKSCRLSVVKDKGRMVLLEWEHDINTVENISCCTVNQPEESGECIHTVKVAWGRWNSIYCDYVSISGNRAALKTELVLEVDFSVSAFYLLWDSGLALVREQPLAHLHVFDTGHARYLGYITLSHGSDSAETVRYDRATESLWVIARKYDELTKSCSAHLNTYNVPNLFLKTSFPLPRSFAHYSFVQAPSLEGLEQFTNRSVAIYSACELLDKTVVQWFLCPRSPWREIDLDHFAPLRPATAQRMPSNTSLPTVQEP